MSDYQFQSGLYPNLSRMLDAVVEADLEGLGHGEMLDEYLGRMSDEAMAKECIEGFGLDQADDYSDEEAQSHMDECGYDVDDLAKAFAKFRTQRAEDAAA